MKGPQDCYVRSPLHRRVCAACLDEDAERGGDHYRCRAGRMWKRSHTGSMAPSCRAPVSVVFEAVYPSFGSCWKAPGSPWCASVISGRARRQPRQSGMLESMSAIARAIDSKGMELDDVEAAKPLSLGRRSTNRRRPHQRHPRRCQRCLSPGGTPPSKPWLSSQAWLSVVQAELFRPSSMEPSGRPGEGRGEPAGASEELAPVAQAESAEL